MKKKDFIFILIVLAAVVSAALFLKIPQNPDTVSVYVDGELFYEYPLSENAEISVNGTNTVKIENGEAYMFFATCPDKLCIHQGKIGKTGKSIICLPNRVSVEVNNSIHDEVSR